MQINDHPVWIKIEPITNRFAFHQNGRWNIGNLDSLLQIIKENAADPKKKFTSYLESKNKVEFFQETIWNDGADVLKPHPDGDGKVVVEAARETDEVKRSSGGENKTEEDEDGPEAEDTDKPMEKRDDSAKDQGEDPEPSKSNKKARWIKVVRKPAYHPTAAGVKAQEEHDKVHHKRDKAQKDVMKAVQKVAKEKT